ncbi:hypothetical protein GUJ93_ZPchr0010g9494 [Zizania palustris]|uniref:Uncharacterized protein n=1 Tax=Zizania palustris TaxID=103762 RepID=A0A8J5WBI3_ZIZPA|nr:hypothetical protein GUJ93_ZPchr0010g9494 [Zizania palustris]
MCSCMAAVTVMQRACMLGICDGAMNDVLEEDLKHAMSDLLVHHQPEDMLYITSPSSYVMSCRITSFLGDPHTLSTTLIKTLVSLASLGHGPQYATWWSIRGEEYRWD